MILGSNSNKNFDQGSLNIYKKIFFLRMGWDSKLSYLWRGSICYHQLDYLNVSFDVVIFGLEPRAGFGLQVKRHFR
jgi:hypothetical protein